MSNNSSNFNYKNDYKKRRMTMYDLDFEDTLTNYENALKGVSMTMYDTDYENTLKNITIGRKLNWLAKNRPDDKAAAFSEEGVSYTFRQLNEQVNEIAKAMISVGVGKNTHVGILGCNSSKWVCVFLACARIGAISVLINASLKHIELAHIFSESDIEYLFMNTSFQNNDLINEVLLVSASNSSFKNIILFDPVEVHFLNKSILSWEGFLHKSEYNAESKLRDLSEDVESGDTFCIHYTSGTTRKSMGAVLKQSGALNAAYATGAALHISKDDALCLPLPLFHCFGSIMGILLSIIHGSTMVAVDSFSPRKTLKAIQDHRCTTVFGVPAMYTMMMNYEHFQDFDLTYLTKGLIGGCKFPMELADRITKEFGMDYLANVWGMTEASSACTLADIHDPYEKRVATVGRPMPHVRMKVIDTSTGHEVETGVPGELCIHGSSVMDGYYKNEAETQKIIDDDGWLHTGDIGFVDEEGYYTVMDRKKDIIIRGGSNISPSEVEAEICTHQGVVDAQVVGVPSEIFGEEIAAFIIANDELMDHELKNYLSKRLDEHKIPRHVFFVDGFVCTGSGKAQKGVMREMASDWIRRKQITYDHRIFSQNNYSLNERRSNFA